MRSLARRSAQPLDRMKTPLAYGIGAFAAAAMAALALAPLLTFLPARQQLLVNAGAAFVVLAAFFISSMLVLHRFHALRWRWLGAVGYVVGFLGYGGFLALTRDDPFALPMTAVQLLTAGAIGGAFVWLCVTACWFTARYFMRSNTSLERTRER
jgi:hypothetical protein